MTEAADLRAEDLDGASLGRDDAGTRLDLRIGEHRAVEVDRLEDAQHLVVDHRRTRQRVGLVGAIEGERAHAVVAEQQRQQLPDRPQPADEHVDSAIAQTGVAVG